MSGDPSAAQVVRFWRAVEMFSPQNVPQPTRNTRPDAQEIVLDVAADEMAPWDSRHWIAKRRPPRGKVWQFSVYAGIYDLSLVREALASVFGRDERYFEARGNGQTALFAFTLDAEGYLVADSPALSACAWAISRLRHPGPGKPGWLDGFPAEERVFIEALNRLVPPKSTSDHRGAATDGLAAKAGKAALGQVKGAATDAVSSGAKATGNAVKVATAAALGGVAGPVIGGIAGAAAGTFVEKLLTPHPAKTAAKTPAETETASERKDAPTDAEGPGTGHPKVPPPRMTPPVVYGFVDSLARDLGIADLLRVGGVRVRCVQVVERNADEAGEQNFLNSFIADDLLGIAKAVQAGDVGAGAAAYLADNRIVPVSTRVDVRRVPDAVVAGAAPNRIPGGRWLTGADRPLGISQQFAVNQIMSELADSSGVFAVNGPPGTGKTTMLRDVLAAVVVQRAQRIVDLRLHHPIEAFTTVTDRVSILPKYTVTVRGLRPELTGSEIVVATAGNKAAANITAEIPGIDAVRGAEEAACAADYFAELASNVLGAPAWGLIAAKLGNRSHRSTFVKHFWWGDPATNTADSDQPDPDQDAEPIRGMREILIDAANEPLTADVWAEAVRRFNDARTEVDRLAAERQQVADVITRLTQRQAQLGPLQAAAEAARAETGRRSAELAALTDQLAQAETAVSDAGSGCDEHAKRQPGFWVSLSTLFRAGREWHAEANRLARVLAEAKGTAGAVKQAVGQCKAALGQASTEQRRRENTLNDALYEIAALENQLTQARGRWPGRVPYRPDFTTEDEFQLCAPWADQAFTEARNRLFLEALRLHKTFILGAQPRLQGNLDAAMAVIRDGRELRTETLRTVWQSFFLVVPVVSTTFASLPRLFRGLGRESFGWLFIDEAGQATPQQALGGIWRAQRSVIVGDPQQLEPIVTLPLSAQHALRRDNQVDEQWTPQDTSAQRIADRLARFGTWLPEPTGQGHVWVGAPLRVHRRCERFMFDISNDIAYGGDLMIYGTKVGGNYPGRSLWIDVRSGKSDGNWVPAEGIALAHLFQTLTDQGVTPDQIRVISPFRDVVKGASNVAGNRLGWPFVKENVGTVHTVQGQESNVIVLVLGSAPHNNRAREWAAETPNLLNVAVSRAKRRLYVIGNRANWHEQLYFDTLATRLPVLTWPEAKAANDTVTIA